MAWSSVVADLPYPAVHRALSHKFPNRKLIRWALPLFFVFISSLWLLGFWPFSISLPPSLPRLLDLTSPPSNPEHRALRVRDAFMHAYSGYTKYAAPSDELLPLTGGTVNNFNGWGVTIFDALDTMWIMGLREEFRSAVSMIQNTKFIAINDGYVPFFETVIRYLGGLLSAYALSGELVLLSLADELGAKLLPAMNTSSGFPMYAINTQTGHTRPGWSGSVLWAEAMSNQMEYKYLAHLTGNREYYIKVETIMGRMYNSNITDGIFPTMWNVQTGKPQNNQFSVGAYADSAHEYLLKQWLLSGNSEPKARDLYIRVANAIIENLLYVTPNRGILYVTDTSNGQPSHKFEHLSCFIPGLLALGVHTLGLSPNERQRHLWAAKGLAYSCWITYADHQTGLGPDEMAMTPFTNSEDGRWTNMLAKWEARGSRGRPPGLSEYPPQRKKESRDYTALKPSYLLRPETIESFYILWRSTGDHKWRERGWTVFEAIERHAKTNYGFASLSSVESIPAPKKNEMPSYFLAETLKYLFLLFCDDDLLPLDKWVFNTEAHPLPVFHWTEQELQWYNLTAKTDLTGHGTIPNP